MEHRKKRLFKEDEEGLSHVLYDLSYKNPRICRIFGLNHKNIILDKPLSEMEILYSDIDIVLKNLN